MVIGQGRSKNDTFNARINFFLIFFAILDTNSTLKNCIAKIKLLEIFLYFFSCANNQSY